MAIFDFQARAEDGRIVKGELDAANEFEAQLPNSCVVSSGTSSSTTFSHIIFPFLRSMQRTSNLYTLSVLLAFIPVFAGSVDGVVEGSFSTAVETNI